MTYVNQLKEYVAERQKAYQAIPMPDLRALLLQELEKYKEEYTEYAKAADDWDGKKDRIHLLLTSMTLHKRQDLTGESEIYYASVMGDKSGGHPQTFVLPKYQQMKKGETWIFRDPLLLYDGNPQGWLRYNIQLFDTQTDNHDGTVDAAQSIIREAGNVVAAAVAAATGPGALAIGPLIDKVSGTIAQTAKAHKDELIEQFVGTLTEHDTDGKRGPYSLAKPEIKLATDDIEVALLVTRVLGAKRRDRGTERAKPHKQRPAAVDGSIVVPTRVVGTRPLTALAMAPMSGVRS